MNFNCCYELSAEEELLDILAKGKICTVFQPIISLQTGDVLGYEALSRGPEKSFLENPCQLFSLADKLGKNLEIENLCLNRALERYSFLGKKELLFLNINPNALLVDYRLGRLDNKCCLYHHLVHPEQVVFELTERNSVINYKKFQRILYYYNNQGFRFAMDDVGAGYSGLTLLVNTQPHFVKIDMELIRGIDKDQFKHNLIKFFVNFGKEAGFHLIAEGIETIEEMATLIKLGVQYGQGYYLAKPSSMPKYLEEEKKQAIIILAEQLGGDLVENR